MLTMDQGGQSVIIGKIMQATISLPAEQEPFNVQKAGCFMKVDFHFLLREVRIQLLVLMPIGICGEELTRVAETF